MPYPTSSFIQRLLTVWCTDFRIKGYIVSSAVATVPPGVKATGDLPYLQGVLYLSNL
ncbi:hypothetical protein [Pontibacter pamirensis]|uniref:hypothetical protein n=1 Tax=Pontibacter pamirensis TaxID=2562824 RepID=UPI00138A0679|nr:hypothetical protein [Pontibacter pamirensis]